jgi:transcriptional regulator with XRE-family HTH domain
MTPSELKKLRLSWGLDQKQLAEKLGVQQSRISEWEQGRKIPPYIVKHLECLKRRIKEMKYPRPELGFYYSHCCLLDLYRISTHDELQEILEEYYDDDEPMGLMIFPTVEAAIDHLGADHTKEEIEATVERLSK